MTKKLLIVLLVAAVVTAGVYFFNKEKSPVEDNSTQAQLGQDQQVLEIEGTEFALSPDAFVQKKVAGKNLPKVFLPQEITPAENSRLEDSRVSFAIAVAKNLEKTDFTPTQLRFVETVDLIVYSQGEATALFSSTKDPISQVDSLQSVLSKAKINAAKISKIDLRFDKPVVTYKN